MDTLGGGLVDQQNLTVALVFIILFSATLPLLVSNLLGFPLSTSAVTVGAVVGAGLAVSQMNGGMLTVIIGAWLALPVAAFVGAAGLSKLVGMRLELRFLRRPQTLIVRLLALALVGGGIYVAFAAGAQQRRQRHRTPGRRRDPLLWHWTARRWRSGRHWRPGAGAPGAGNQRQARGESERGERHRG